MRKCYIDEEELKHNTYFIGLYLEPEEHTVPVILLEMNEWERILGVIQTAEKLSGIPIVKTINTILDGKEAKDGLSNQVQNSRC